MASKLLITLAGLAVASAALVAGQDLTRADGDRMAQKLATIEARGNMTPTPRAASESTSFTDREVNAYFRYNGKSQLPEGVIDPQVTVQSDTRIDARAMVDLDAVRKASQSWMAGLLHGSVEVRVSGTITAANGKGTVQILSATLGGIPIPATLLQDVVSQYSKTPVMPNGFQLDKPFDLPANIREVRLKPGAVTVVQ
jgi:hypothetical protein